MLANAGLLLETGLGFTILQLPPANRRGQGNARGHAETMIGAHYPTDFLRSWAPIGLIDNQDGICCTRLFTGEISTVHILGRISLAQRKTMADPRMKKHRLDVSVLFFIPEGQNKHKSSRFVLSGRQKGLGGWLRSTVGLTGILPGSLAAHAVSQATMVASTLRSPWERRSYVSMMVW